MYVDNSDITGPILANLFPNTLIKEDTTHLMRRPMRTLTPGHPLNRKNESIVTLANVTSMPCCEC